MALFKNKKDSENLNLYEMTPLRNYTHQENDNGLIDVLVPRFTDKFFGKLLMPRLKNKYIKANLDEIGTQTWFLIDGNTQVSEICEKLQSKFGEAIEPAADRLTLFIQQLYRNGFITFKEIRKD